MAVQKKTTQLQLALRNSRSVIVYGGDVPMARVLEVAGGKRPVEPLDLRARTLETSMLELRQQALARLTRHPVLALLLGTYVPDGVRTLIAEVDAGRLNLDRGKLPDAARILAISPTDSPEPQLTELFATMLPAQDALRLVEAV